MEIPCFQVLFQTNGVQATLTGYAVKCDLNHPELKQGFNPTRNGMYILLPGTLFLVDFCAFDRTQGITKEHLEGVLKRITGIPDVKITALHLASAFTDRSKQATTYRKGRILLAGDAAHIHSPLGAQGLNLGLGDAMNLGWKLAATVRRDSRADDAPVDLTLLDTYESERHPIGAWVLDWTRSQALALTPGQFGEAMRTLITDLMSTTDGTNLFIDRIWGLSQRYNLGDNKAQSHPLVGSSAPELELLDGSRLGSKLEGGRGLLVDLENSPALKELVAGGKYERVDYIRVSVKDRRDLSSLLIRPDGIVGWVAEDNVEADLDAAKVALEWWFGC
jgi:hypothetical protein